MRSAAGPRGRASGCQWLQAPRRSGPGHPPALCARQGPGYRRCSDRRGRRRPDRPRPGQWPSRAPRGAPCRGPAPCWRLPWSRPLPVAGGYVEGARPRSPGAAGPAPPPSVPTWVFGFLQRNYKIRLDYLGIVTLLYLEYTTRCQDDKRRSVPHSEAHDATMPRLFVACYKLRPFVPKYGRIYVICCQDDMR